MGRLIVEQWVTADGFAAEPDGGLEFVQPGEDAAAITEHQLAMLEGVDAILLGRRTYALFEAYWPTRSARDEPVAEPINRLPKHVISHTLAHAPWGDYASATVENGEPRDVVRRLKLRHSGDIIVWGSLTLAGALFQAQLVDRLRLRVAPVLIGAGRTATPGLRSPRRLSLVEATAFTGGHMVLEYDVR